MRFLIALAVCWTATLAGTSPAEETELITAPLSRVTVFPNGAELVHRGTTTLPTGTTQLLAALFEGSANDYSTIGMQVATTGAQVQGFSLVNHRRPAAPQEIAALQTEIDAADEAHHTAVARASNAQSDLKLLDDVAGRMAEGAATLERPALIELLDFLSQRRAKFIEDHRRQIQAAQRLQETLDSLRSRQLALQEGTPIVCASLLLNSAGGDTVVTITRSGAGKWNPIYQVRRASGGERATTTMSASVTNNSALDWSNVELILSSAGPNPHGLLAGITPVVVDEARDNKSGATALSEAIESDDHIAFGRQMQTSYGAGLSQAGIVSTYTLGDPATVKRGVQRQLPIARFTSACFLEAVARPTVSDDVVQQLNLKNDSPLLMLPGEVQLFVDGTFVGRTFLGLVAAGESFSLSNGPMPGVRMTRTILERTTVKTGLLGGGRLTSTRYRIELENLQPDPLEVILEDRMPESRTSEIEVVLKNLTSALSTNAAYLANDRPLGILRWDLTLPPSASTTIEWTITVSRSADLKITPIPQ